MFCPHDIVPVSVFCTLGDCGMQHGIELQQCHDRLQDQQMRTGSSGQGEDPRRQVVRVTAPLVLMLLTCMRAECEHST